MKQKALDKTADSVEQPVASTIEMAELKREMRSAQWSDWAQKNQQSLLIAVGLVLVGLVAGGMWIKHNRSQHDAEAILYQQAVNAANPGKKTALLKSLVGNFGSSVYGAMAQMQLSALDSAHAAAHLQAVINNPSAMAEWKWQARLDLAQLEIEQGHSAAAHTLLQQAVGKEYRQLRYFLLASIAKDPAKKKLQLQKALAAPAPDTQLKQKIETQLSLLAS